MALFTAALADYCSTHLGVVNDEELAVLGVTPTRRRALVESEILVPVHRGVYRLRSTPITLEGRSRAACVASPDVVITGRAAGKLWGLRRMGHVDMIEARAPYLSHTFADERILLRRCPPLPAADVVLRDDGIRVVSPPRLAFDLAADLSDIDFESVVEQILDRRYCTMATLLDTGRRLFHPSRPGSYRFDCVIAARPAWLKPVDSHHELVLYDALRRAGVAGMTRQHRLELPGGWPIHADIAIPALRWAIPIDHVTSHGGRVDAQRDKQNDRQARMIRWQVDRVTDGDIDELLDQTIGELPAIYHVLAPTLRPASPARSVRLGAG